jgi:hypothetical protein
MEAQERLRDPLKIGEDPIVGPEWVPIIPDGQYVLPEEGVHFMIAPHDDTKFLRVEHLEPEQLEPVCRLILPFLQGNPARQVCYNIAPDKSRKTSQSWHNLHMHFLQLPSFERMAEVERLPFKMREFAWRMQSSALLELYKTRANIPPSLKTVQLPTCHPMGGIEFVLPDDLNPKTLAEIIKYMDTSYREIHRSIVSLFVSNYDNVYNSNGQVGYESVHRNQESQIDTFDNLPETKTYLRHLCKFLKFVKDPNTTTQMSPPENTDTIIRVPAYTTVFTNINNKYYLQFMPHLFRDSGGTEVRGIELERKSVDTIPEDGRVDRADECIKSLMKTVYGNSDS